MEDLERAKRRRILVATTGTGEETTSGDLGAAAAATTSRPLPEMSVRDQVRLCEWHIVELDRQRGMIFERMQLLKEKEALAAERKQVEENQQSLRAAQAAVEEQHQKLRALEGQWRQALQKMESEKTALVKEVEELREARRSLEEEKLSLQRRLQVTDQRNQDLLREKRNLETENKMLLQENQALWPDEDEEGAVQGKRKLPPRIRKGSYSTLYKSLGGPVQGPKVSIAQVAKEQVNLFPLEPGKPRGRMTAYAYFVQERRVEQQKQFPGVSVSFVDFSKECSDKWKTVTDEEKKRFHNLAEKDKRRFDKEMAEFNKKKEGALSPTAAKPDCGSS